MTCTGCDCVCIEATINYYTAAVTVDQNQLNTDQAEKSYWQSVAMMCACGTMMAAAPVEPLTIEKAELRKIIDDMKSMHEQIKALSPKEPC